jgi:hypothetical protein
MNKKLRLHRKRTKEQKSEMLMMEILGGGDSKKAGLTTMQMIKQFRKKHKIDSQYEKEMRKKELMIKELA